VKLKGVYEAMKKTQEIIGLPIISISDGMEAGKVKSVIVNAEKGAIDYIVVDSGINAIGTRVIPSEKILGIGEYALTIEDEGAISDIGNIPSAIDLLQKDIQIKNTKVLTKKGRLIGQTGDFFADEDEGLLVSGLEFIANTVPNNVRIIPRKSVITFGKNLIVVTEDVESTLRDDMDGMREGNAIPEDEKKNLTSGLSYAGSTGDASDQPEALPEENPADKSESAPAAEAPSTADVGEAIEQAASAGAVGLETAEPVDAVAVETEAIAEAPPKPETPTEPVERKSFVAPPPNSAASLFEQRQRQYLKGRKSTKTIADNSGNVIINEGDLINDEVIDAAKQCGKLIELVMNNKA